MDRRQFVAGLGAGMLGAGLAGRSFAQQAALPAHYPADYKAIVEASRGQPDVVMYTSFPDSFWQPAKNRLKTLYPWINWQTLDLGGPEIIERHRLEKGASSRGTDILVFNGPGEWYELSTEGELLDYKSPEMAHLPDWSLRLPGAFFVTVDADVFFWNKLLLPEGAKSLESLVEQAKAKPELFKGRLATYAPYQQSSYYLSFANLLKHHGEKLWGWLEVLAPLTRIERSGGTMFEKTLSGEYVLSYFVNQNPAVLASRDPQKSPIFGWGFPTDGTPVPGRFGGIPKTAQAQASAKLILDFLLSHEGQVMVAAGGRFPYRDDVTAADIGPNAYTFQMVVDAVGRENVLIVEYDPALMANQKEIIDRWKSIYKV